MSKHIKFDVIKNIKENDLNYGNKIFLTFDLDWCSDEVLLYTLEILEKKNAKATIFVTHSTPLLARIKENKNFELGIHPNFNFLLNGDFRYGKNIGEVFDCYLKIIPEAVSFRSHALVQGSHVNSLAIKKGLKFNCNMLIPLSSNMILKPFDYGDKLVHVPYFFEDDVHFAYEQDWNVEKYIQHHGIKVFDFHPIHIFLNTDIESVYIKAKEHQHDHSTLSTLKNNVNYGSRNFLLDILDYKNYNNPTTQAVGMK